uniref:ATP-binding protein n=3 Tax=Bacteroides TaxID=816 RepID=UPI0031B5CB13
MELGLKCFGAENTMGFPKLDMNVWVSEHDKLILTGNQENSHGPIYAKIECKDVLSHFVFYAKLETINPVVNLGDGFLWMPKDLAHKSWLISAKTKVEISIVEYDITTSADSITIQLTPEAVKNWADDEIERAESNVRSSSRIFFESQMIYIKPITKKTTMGEVESIYPKSEKKNILYRLTENTKIHFIGLPTNRQKAIDFSQIGGLKDVINKLREIIQIPINNPELLQRFGIKPPKGMLMYGPPGNGKTMIARAVAYSMGSSFITIEGPELMSKYVGVGEQRLREKFEEAEAKGNCIVFIDEIDSITSKRSDDSAEYQVSIVATLLNLMDGMNSNNKVFVIGATNRLNAIDPALRRPGRFDLEFEVPLPNVSARYDILTKYVKLENNDLFNNVDNSFLQLLSELTNGYSGADLSLLY